jgi:hypothetical protein
MLGWQKLLQLAKNIPKFHLQPQCILQLVSEEFVSSELIFTFLNVGSSIQNSSEQFAPCIQISYVQIAIHPTPQTKNLIYQRRRRDEQWTPYSNSCTSVTIQKGGMFIWTCFLTMTESNASKILTFPPKSPCITNLSSQARTAQLSLWQSVCSSFQNAKQNCGLQFLSQTW